MTHGKYHLQSMACPWPSVNDRIVNKTTPMNLFEVQLTIFFLTFFKAVFTYNAKHSDEIFEKSAGVRYAIKKNYIFYYSFFSTLI